MFVFFAVFRWFRRLVYLAIVAAFVYLVVTSIQVVVASRVSRQPSSVPVSSAIVVVGAPTAKGRISADLEARCRQAGLLFHAHRARQVVTTRGSSGRTTAATASLLASCLRQDAVPRRAITEVSAGSLPDAFRDVAADLDVVGPRGGPGPRVIIVADPLETKWVLAVARAENLPAVASPAPAARQGFWSAVGTIWDQALAVGAGRIIGFENTGWAGG